MQGMRGRQARKPFGPTATKIRKLRAISLSIYYESVSGLGLSTADARSEWELLRGPRNHRQPRTPAAQPATKARKSTQVGTITATTPKIARPHDNQCV